MAFKHAYSYVRMIVASPLTFLKFYFYSDSIICCFSEDEVEKSANESMDPSTLEVVTVEANLLANALMDETYGGISAAYIASLSKASQSSHQILIVQIPAYLTSYNRKTSSAARSVDFNTPDHPIADGHSVLSDTEPTLGDSRTPSQSYLRNIQAITAQVIAHFNKEGKSPSQSVPSPTATSTSSSVRFSDGSASG